jgi:MerR family transcriptional regulator, mercuric resistance operon regulatory protein
MRIGELADDAGITPATIRYYERIGLLSEPERTPSGYREYPHEILELRSNDLERMRSDLQHLAEIDASGSGDNSAVHCQIIEHAEIGESAR